MGTPGAKQFVFTFASTYAVLRAEREMKQNGFEVTLVPTPREVSADCGTALEVRGEDFQAVQRLLAQQGGLDMVGAHELNRKRIWRL